MQKYFKISSFYLLFGLVMGIFSREFTKLNNFSGYTVLKSVHTSFTTRKKLYYF